MPLTNTAGSLPDFTGVLNGSDISDRMKQIEFWLNGGIGAGELQAGSPWVGAEQVIRPQFFGGANPRTIGQAWHSWHQLGGLEKNDWFLVYDDFSDDEYLPIPKLTATIHVPPIDTGGTVGMFVAANWYSYEANGLLASTNAQQTGPIAAKFRLYLDGTPYGHTQRQINAQSNTTTGLGKDHSVVFWIPSVSAGRHDIGIRVAPLAATDTASSGVYRDWMHIWVAVRSFLCDITLL